MLRFDNTYSWTRTKEVKFSVRVLAPDPQMVQAYQEEFLPEDPIDEDFQECTNKCVSGKTADTSNLEPPSS